MPEEQQNELVETVEFRDHNSLHTKHHTQRNPTGTKPLDGHHSHTDPAITVSTCAPADDPAETEAKKRRTGVKWADVCCPEPSQADVVTRGSPPAEESLEQDRAVKQAAMEREVIAALGKGEPDEVMSSAFKLRVTCQDIRTLRSLCWLNDEVINFYMGLVMERSKKAGYPSVHAFSSFFYEKLTSGGYEAVGRWTRHVDLFQKDIILVPINLRLHWTLAVIDTRKKTVKYYDSLGQEGDKICETLLKYLQEESCEKRKVKLSVLEWTVHSMEPHEIPQQSNGSDCGVFICKYADYISRDRPMTFTQTHMPYFRKKMVWEILHQELL
ncbi:sentrin-specific protease 2-like [Larus michahellis]|uniref:sentrin-specific protease 2-like n=1 Tax=Larus michahellis TaxID=119627 RepID=UPI003D9B6132